jgi:hypothetical protein
MTTDIKINKPLHVSPPKPKRRPGHPANLEIADAERALTGGHEVTVLSGDNDDEPATRSRQKPPRRRNPASKKSKELAKLDELFLRAWKETYESRKRRV